MIDFVFLIVQNSCQQFLHLIQKGVTNIYVIIILSNMGIYQIILLLIHVQNLVDAQLKNMYMYK